MIKARVKRNSYFDSITLMNIARSLVSLPGIEDAAAIMATEPNLQQLQEAGLTPFEGKAGSADVLIVVRASNDSSADAALQAAEELLTQRPTGGSISPGEGNAVHQPRSLEQALQQQTEAHLAAISVPGPYAALEAERALRAGLHVFLFSNNVALEDEVMLKQLAQEHGLLLMGPDCGTAMLNGVGLGFVNAVPRGSIGIVGASGTGIQQVMSLIAQRSEGISQVIGCGGRDLSEAVGAITTLQGLQLLQEDEQTEVIVLISKPPAPAVAERVLQAAKTGQKAVIVMFVGADVATLRQRYGERLTITRTLAEAAEGAIHALSHAHPSGPLEEEDKHISWHSSAPPQTHIPIAPGVSAQGRLMGLFSGGTLCEEAMYLWTEQLGGAVYSNIPLNPAWQLREGQSVQGHCVIDFGADEYTRGRPHPMIDPSLRLKRFQEEASDPQVRVILLDIVLGYCSHPDPASVYAPVISTAIEQARQAERPFTCVISLCGTEDDPQVFSAQASQLLAAGAEVFTSNAAAALRCLELIS